MTHRGWIAVSGFIWLGIGLLLLYKGLRLISDSAQFTDTICFRFRELFGSSEQSGTVLIAAALFLGFLKSRLILAKTVRRVTARILSLAMPVSLRSVYASSYWILIGSMMVVGFCMRFVPVPMDLRGCFDVAIGSALINGSMLYFRAARMHQT